MRIRKKHRETEPLLEDIGNRTKRGENGLPLLHLLLVDDDPLFIELLSRTAREQRIALTSCRNISELDSIAMPGIFDVAIIDYYLDGMQRDLKGPIIAQKLGTTPTILISQKPESLIDSEPWPDNIGFYLNKTVGTDAIIQAVIELKDSRMKPKAKTNEL